MNENEFETIQSERLGDVVGGEGPRVPQFDSLGRVREEWKVYLYYKAAREALENPASRDVGFSTP